MTARDAGEPISGAASRTGTVALIGRPNVGKSTLLNRLVGEKVAIVSSIPQTTRTRVLGIKHLPGAEIIFLDTPGIHTPRHLLNEMMLRTARAVLEEADVVCVVVDVSAGWGANDRLVLDLVRGRGAPVLLILNKVDRMPKPKILPVIDESLKVFDFAEIFPISAKQDDEFDALLRAIVDRLPTGEARYPADEYTDQTVRVMAAEFIREAVLAHTREEVPHSVAVRIEEFQEDEAKGLVRIKALVLVEKASQRGILIGAKGGMMKQVGEQARAELERLLGRRVFIGLWVGVEPEWRQDPRALQELGYT